MKPEPINKIIAYLTDADNNKWATSAELIEAAGLAGEMPVRQEIFNRIFDNHPNVKLLAYPEESGGQRLAFLKDRVELVDWGYFERMPALEAVKLVGG